MGCGRNPQADLHIFLIGEVQNLIKKPLRTVLRISSIIRSAPFLKFLIGADQNLVLAKTAHHAHVGMLNSIDGRLVSDFPDFR